MNLLKGCSEYNRLIERNIDRFIHSLDRRAGSSRKSNSRLEVTLPERIKVLSVPLIFIPNIILSPYLADPVKITFVASILIMTSVPLAIQKWRLLTKSYKADSKVALLLMSLQIFCTTLPLFTHYSNNKNGQEDLSLRLGKLASCELGIFSLGVFLHGVNQHFSSSSEVSQKNQEETGPATTSPEIDVTPIPESIYSSDIVALQTQKQTLTKQVSDFIGFLEQHPNIKNKLLEKCAEHEFRITQPEELKDDVFKNLSDPTILKAYLEIYVRSLEIDLQRLNLRIFSDPEIGALFRETLHPVEPSNRIVSQEQSQQTIECHEDVKEEDPLV